MNDPQCTSSRRIAMAHVALVLKVVAVAVVALLVLCFGLSNVSAAGPCYTCCPGGNCAVAVVPQPATVYVPQVTYQPYQHLGTAVVERRYATPFRDAWFGRYRAYSWYAPMTPAVPQHHHPHAHTKQK